MDNGPDKIAVSLPSKLKQWIDEIVCKILPLETQDYYRTKLQKEAFDTYKEFLIEDKDESQAIRSTIQKLGNPEAVIRKVNAEIEIRNLSHRNNLWKVPMIISIIFFIVTIISICIDIGFIQNGQWYEFYQSVFKSNGAINPHEWNGVTGVSVYGQYIGGILVWTVVSIIATISSFVMALHMKNK